MPALDSRRVCIRRRGKGGTSASPSLEMTSKTGLVAGRVRCVAPHECGLDRAIGAMHAVQAFGEAGVYDAMEPYRWLGTHLTEIA